MKSPNFDPTQTHFFLFYFLESVSFPLLPLEDEGVFTTSSSTATTPQSQDTIQEVSILPNETHHEVEETANATDA